MKTARALAILLVLSIQMGCATRAVLTAEPPKPLTPYETANLTFAANAADYKVALQVCKDFRKARLMNDEQWGLVVAADMRVKEWAPIVHELLEIWGKFGQKPTGYDEANDNLATAYSEVTDIKKGLGQ